MRGVVRKFPSGLISCGWRLCAKFCRAILEFKTQLEEARSLMGPQGSRLNLTELLAEMTRLGVEKLKEKKFGKRRMQAEAATHGGSEAAVNLVPHTFNVGSTHTGLARRSLQAKAGAPATDSGAGVASQRSARYISQSVRHAVWRSAGGKCAACGSQHNLQFDHVQPVALGLDASSGGRDRLQTSVRLTPKQNAP